MNYPRVLPNAVVLPDGQVLIVGGGGTFKYTNPVKVPELYAPATGTWGVMAPQQAGRMYHPTALLARHGEIFSPPYLFRGARPTISGAPASVSQGGQLELTSPDAADIGRVVLIRPGSSTHEIDSDQRSIPLRFTVLGGTVTAQIPGNANEAPPGYYMLFAVNGRGVSSHAPWVRIAEQ